MLMHMNGYRSFFSGSGTIKRIGMPSGPSGNIGKMITNFIMHCSHHLSSHWLKAYS